MTSSDKLRTLLAEQFRAEDIEITRLLNERDFAGAVARCKALASRFENLPQFCHRYGDALMRRQFVRDAITWYERAIKAGGRDAHYYLALADAYAALEDGADAEIQALWEGVRDSFDPLAIYGRLENLLISGNYRDEAFRLVDTIKERFRHKPELCYLQAEAAHSIDLLPTAVELLRRSQNANYFGHRHYFILGDCFGYFGMDEQSIRFLLRQMERNDGPVGDALRGIYDIIKWRRRGGDDRLLAAIHWEYLTLYADRGLGRQTQMRYLDAEPEPSRAVYQEFREKHLGNPKHPGYAIQLEIGDQMAYAAFFLRLLLYHREHRSDFFSARESLIECAELLSSLAADSIESRYFLMWARIEQKEFRDAQRLAARLDEDIARRIYPGQNPSEFNYALHLIADALPAKSRRDRQKPGVSEAKLEKPEQAELQEFGIDLTAQYRAKKRAAPVSASAADVARLAHALQSGGPLCIVLTGPSGVGKSETVRALACALAGPAAPSGLEGHAIIESSTSVLVAGAGILGTWQERLLAFCHMASLDNKRIIYLEDLHNIFGVGRVSDDKSRFADVFLPLLERRQIAVIGEMTHRQLEDLRAREPRFFRMAKEIPVTEPSRDQMIEILHSWAHAPSAGSLEFSPPALQQIYNLGRTFMPYRAFPGKAREILDGVIATRETEARPSGAVGAGDVTASFCRATGIPEFIVDERVPLDQDRLRTFFAERVLGQDQAIRPVTEAVASFKARINDPNKPIRSFLFVGPTGVGKTEMAKVLAEYVFGDRGRIIRLNMSEYSDANAASKLIAAPHQFNPQAGHFLAEVRRSPFSIVLLDEIEKAHPDVFHLLLQMLDEGILQDETGTPAYFQSSFVIMTSNLGARRYTDRQIGFGGGDTIGDLQQQVMKDIREFFNPEVLNRIDELVFFTPLDEAAIRRIINREVGKLLDRQGIIERGIQVEVDPLVLDHIMEIGYDARYGARNIKRTVERLVATPLAQVMAGQSVPADALIRINLKEGTPTAHLIRAEEWLLPDHLRARQNKEQTDVTALSQQELKGMAGALAARVDSLKQKLRYEELMQEHQALQKEMLRPGFWDTPGRANEVVRRYAAVNRRTERIHKWESLCGRIDALLQTSPARMAAAEKARVRSQVLGLSKELESAELEILLEGKYDSADCFVLIAAESSRRDHIRWVHELAGVYRSWARRRSYPCRAVGEALTGDRMEYGVVLHIGGMNAFGLLKNERGIYRRTSVDTDGRAKSRESIDGQVIVLADVQPLADAPRRATVTVQKLKKSQAGHFVAQLSRQVTAQAERGTPPITFLADAAIEKDGNLPQEMYLSYLHYRQRSQARPGSEHNGAWGSLVRTYFTGRQNRIVDHETKMVIDDVKGYFNGKIDSLLLERII
ncbi:MAG TPA: AAA family ATPase [bacterium]|nr:AAA family ATPase [bacterium]